IHSECLTGDVFGSQRCDCGGQLDESMRRIAEEKNGLVIYLRQEGRGIGLSEKIRAYALQDNGLDTVEANVHLGFDADLRDYDPAAQILRAMGIRRVRILTNNPAKIDGLQKYGIEVVERLSIHIPCTKHNQRYLETKKNKLGHWL
ncbi:MAG: GTP cyclohydrolase II, partial [Kiritimatiellia bacterium]|nr:GTP cyclohydrolase II [Kiritimatiellia bacterium]